MILLKELQPTILSHIEGMDLANIWKVIDQESILVRSILNPGTKKPRASIMARLKKVLTVNVEWGDTS
jgi:hypothetical protein